MTLCYRLFPMHLLFSITADSYSRATWRLSQVAQFLTLTSPSAEPASAGVKGKYMYGVIAVSLRHDR